MITKRNCGHQGHPGIGPIDVLQRAVSSTKWSKFQNHDTRGVEY